MSSFQIRILLTILNLSTTITFASYLTTRLSSLNRAINHAASFSDELINGLIFGLLSVLAIFINNSNIFSYSIEVAILAPIIAGFTGGIVPGLLAGVIGGVVALTENTISSLALFFACVFSGLLSGVVYFFNRSGKYRLVIGFILGFVCDAVWYLLVCLTNNFSKLATFYVEVFCLPTLIIIPLAIAVSIALIYDIIGSKDVFAAKTSDRLLQIINKSSLLQFNEFNGEVKQSVVDNVLSQTDLNYVAIFDNRSCVYSGGSIFSIDEHSREDTDFLNLCDILTSLPTALDYGYPVTVEHSANIPQLKYFAKNNKFSHCYVIVSPIYARNEKLGSIIAIAKGDTAPRSYVRLISGVGNYIGTQIQQHYIESQSKLLASAEYEMLKAQVNPHFLFNTLNTINSLIKVEPQKASTLIADLATYYRHTLSNKDDLISISQEIAFCELYLTIQKARFGDRLEITINVPPKCQEILVPCFSVQPLIENCFKHGFANQTGKIHIDVTARLSDDNMLVSVSDNGAGFKQEIIDSFKQGNGTVGGIGLNNINRRFVSIFGDNYNIDIKNQKNGATVQIKVPLSIPQEENDEP